MIYKITLNFRGKFNRFFFGVLVAIGFIGADVRKRGLLNFWETVGFETWWFFCFFMNSMSSCEIPF